MSVITVKLPKDREKPAEQRSAEPSGPSFQFQDVRTSKVLRNLLKEQEKKAGSPEGGAAMMEHLMGPEWKDRAEVPGLVSIEVSVSPQGEADAEACMEKESFVKKLEEQAEDDGVGVPGIRDAAKSAPESRPEGTKIDKVLSMLEKLLGIK